MNTGKHGSEEDLIQHDLTEKVIGVFYDVYNELGHGFLESVYHKAMVIALRGAGFLIASEVPIPVFFRGQRVGDFSADILVNDAVLLELKAVKEFDTAHEAQLLNYLRATPIEVGLLLNFGPKPAFRRRLFTNDRKRHHPKLV